MTIKEKAKIMEEELSYCKFGFNIDKGILKKYDGSEEYVTVPSVVKKINNAFSCNRKIKKVIISDSVQEIGELSFIECYELKEVVIPDSVTKIGSCAFDDCINLEKIYIPDSVKTIGTNAFLNCKNLELSVPKNCKCDETAFLGCKKVNYR